MPEQPKQPALNLHQKLAMITGDVGAIAKGGTNSEQKYAFIEYAAVAGELRGLFAKYNVLIVPYMQKTQHQQRTEVQTKYGNKGEHVLIDFTFVVINADDPTDKFSVSWTGEAIDYGDKATNKAATSALKYYLMRQFNISEKGDDPDAVSPEAVVPAAKQAKPQPVVTEQEVVIEPDAPASGMQKGMITQLLRKLGISDENMVGVVAVTYGLDLKELTNTEAADLIKLIKKNPPEVES